MGSIANMSHAPTILVVEDDASNRDLLSDVLAAERYKVILAANGTQALDAFKQKRPDLILCDYLLPDMDGTAVCEQLARYSPQGSPPVIMVTALSLANVRSTDPYTAVIQKPFDLDELLDLVRRCLADARDHRSA